MKTAVALLAFAGVVPVVQAADDVKGWYIGGSAGRSDAKRTSSWAQTADANNLLLGGLTSTTAIDNHETGWKVYVGYQFNENFAAEGGYTDFGRFHGVSNISAPAAGTSSSKWDATSPMSASLVGIWPIWRQLSVFGKLGLAFTHLEGEVNGPITFKMNANRVQPLLGVGLKYDINRQFGLRAEFERFNNVGDGSITGQSNIYLWTAGVQYHF